MVESVKSVKSVKASEASEAIEEVIPRDASEIVSVKNITRYDVNTSQGCIRPGEIGFASIAEAQVWLGKIEEV